MVEPTGIDSGVMAGKASEGFGGGDVPEESGFITAHGCEAGVVGGDGEGEDFVAVGVVGLDVAGGGGVEEVDFTVLAAG